MRHRRRIETKRSEVAGAWHSTAHDVFGAVIDSRHAEISRGLDGKIHTSVCFPETLATFGDVFVDAIFESNKSSIVSLLVDVFLTTHRPKKPEDAKKVDVNLYYIYYIMDSVFPLIEAESLTLELLYRLM